MKLRRAADTGCLSGWDANDTSGIVLMGLVALEGGVLIARDEVLKLLKFGLRAIIVRVRYEDNPRRVAIAQGFEGASAATLIKMVRPLGAVLIDQLLLYHKG